MTLLLTAMWIGSAWFVAGWSMSDGSGVMFRSGVVIVHADPGGPNRQHFYARPYKPEFYWGFSWYARSRPSGGSYWAFSVPLWIPAAGALIFTAIVWRLDTLARRRARLNLCPKCHYDRAGLAAGAVCPECGATGA